MRGDVTGIVSILIRYFEQTDITGNRRDVKRGKAKRNVSVFARAAKIDACN